MVDCFPTEVMKIRPRPYLGLYIWNVQTSITFVRLDEFITFLVILNHSDIVLTKTSDFVFGRDLQALMAVRYPQCERGKKRRRRNELDRERPWHSEGNFVTFAAFNKAVAQVRGGSNSQFSLGEKHGSKPGFRRPPSSIHKSRQTNH